jgi:hypothetical protein
MSDSLSVADSNSNDNTDELQPYVAVVKAVLDKNNLELLYLYRVCFKIAELDTWDGSVQ